MLPYYKGEDTYFVGVDALELEKGNTVAALSVYSAKYLMTIYMPVSEFTRATRSQNDIDIFRKDIIANINKFFVDEELLNWCSIIVNCGTDPIVRYETFPRNSLVSCGEFRTFAVKT